ncbi:ferric-chelate reductase (NADH) [Sarracenia purpurea var. burkii]
MLWDKSSTFFISFMLIDVLGCFFLHFQKKVDKLAISLQKFHFYQPLGIVTAMELVFTVMFAALLIWSLANYLYWSFGNLHFGKVGEKVFVVTKSLFSGPVLERCVMLLQFSGLAVALSFGSGVLLLQRWKGWKRFWHEHCCRSNPAKFSMLLLS